jgi:hypothetical protein
VPLTHAIKTLVKNIEAIGSALKTKPPGKRRTLRTPENVMRVMTALHCSP